MANHTTHVFWSFFHRETISIVVRCGSFIFRLQRHETETGDKSVLSLHSPAPTGSKHRACLHATHRSIRSRCFLSDPRDEVLPASITPALRPSNGSRCPFALCPSPNSNLLGDLDLLELLPGEKLSRLGLLYLVLLTGAAPAATCPAAAVAAAAAAVGTGGLRCSRCAPPTRNQQKAKCESRHAGQVRVRGGDSPIHRQNAPSHAT